MAEARKPKKLIETSLPIEQISRANRAEKNIKTGTARNLHKWFAPMPAPAWRALIPAIVLDDPEDDDERRDILEDIRALVPSNGGTPDKDALRRIRARMARAFTVDELLVVDPFCGAGSTLIEAQRLGLLTAGNDLNPVPALISKQLTELLPKCRNQGPFLSVGPSALLHADPYSGFKEDAQSLIIKVQESARADLEKLYGRYDSNWPYAWLWAHVVCCPNPACNLPVPLFASSTLSAQPKKESYLTLEVIDDKCCFGVTSDVTAAARPTKMSGRKSEFKCPRCGQEFDEEHVKKVGNESGLSEQMVATAWTRHDGFRWFEEPSLDQTDRVPRNYPDMDGIDLPDEALGFRVQAYGFKNYLDLYTPRQAWTLATYARVVANLKEEMQTWGCPEEYGLALLAFLGLCVGRQARFLSKQATWRTRKGPSKVEAGFSQQVVTMVWDFAEANPSGKSVGDWVQVGATALRAVDSIPKEGGLGTVHIGDAETVASRLPATKPRIIVATDPPYFDAIGYADLADYFYLWHREALKNVFPDLYATSRSPRFSELIADKGRHGNSDSTAREYFIEKFKSTFQNLAVLSDGEFPMIIIYAHQQKEGAYGGYGSTGWEAMLQALVDAGIAITASWPMHATSPTRSRGMSSNALATYIVLACRKRREESPASTRRSFISRLREELPKALKKLQQGGIAPVDLNQAAIGPGMSIFSNYSSVMEPDGQSMSVRSALAIINQVRDESLAEQEGDFDTDTRFCVKWFAQHGWDEQQFDRAESLARSVNTSVDGLVRAGVFWARAGKARLIEPNEMSEGWNPLTDDRISIWEVTIRLAKTLENKGAEDAARLMAAAGKRIDLDAAKELAYLLFSVCEKRKWMQTALMFNGLGTFWSDLSAAARTDDGHATTPSQGELDFASIEE